MARILVADDEAPMRDLMALACQMDGHTVQKAIDAPSAIGAYASFRPQLLLLDLNMPGGGGVYVLQQLHFAFGADLCPVLVVSGYLAEVSAADLKALGATAVLEKPFTIESLRTMVRASLAAAR